MSEKTEEWRTTPTEGQRVWSSCERLHPHSKKGHRRSALKIGTWWMRRDVSGKEHLDSAYRILDIYIPPAAPGEIPESPRIQISTIGGHSWQRVATMAENWRQVEGPCSDQVIRETAKSKAASRERIRDLRAELVELRAETSAAVNHLRAELTLALERIALLEETVTAPAIPPAPQHRPPVPMMPPQQGNGTDRRF